MWTCTWPLLISHESLPSHLYIWILWHTSTACKAHKPCWQYNAWHTQTWRRIRSCTLLRKTKNAYEQQSMATVMLSAQQELHCLNAACMSGCTCRVVLVLTSSTDYIWCLKTCLVRKCVQHLKHAIKGNIALEQRTLTRVCGSLLCRASHSNISLMCRCPSVWWTTTTGQRGAILCFSLNWR